MEPESYLRDVARRGAESAPVPVEVIDGTAEQLPSGDGAFEVAVSDTIGIAHPGQVKRVLGQLLTRVAADRVALHFHDTRGTALANVLVSLDFGIQTFDASAGGLGGCPYAPGATGNLATEDLVYVLHGLGIDTGVNLDALFEASRQIEPLIGHPLPSRYVQARKATGSKPV